MSDARMRERRGDSCNFYSWRRKKKKKPWHVIVENL